MVLELVLDQEKEWVIHYMNETYSKKSHFVAMLDYLGLDGWKLITTTKHTSKEEEGETLYFRRRFRRVAQEPKLQALINEIDAKSNKRFVQPLEIEENASTELMKPKVLKHLYEWLEKQRFEWGAPGSGARESHYLNKMEDVTEDLLFPKHHGINKVSTRIDIFKEPEQLKIILKRRIEGSWINYSEFTFPYTKDGVHAIQETLSMQFNKLLRSR